MYLKNVVCVGDDRIELELVNKNPINFNNSWRFVCSPHEEQFLLKQYQYDFNTVHSDESRFI